MGFKTHKRYNPNNAYLMMGEQKLYSSPWDGMKAMANLTSYLGVADPEFNLTSAGLEFGQKQMLKYGKSTEEEAKIPMLSAADANALYRPPTPYTEEVRADIAEFEHKSRNRNQKLKSTLASMSPDEFGSTLLPMLGAIGGALTDPVSLGLDLISGGMLGTLSKVGTAAKAAWYLKGLGNAARALGYGSKAKISYGLGKGNTAKNIAKYSTASITRNFIENMPVETIVHFSNKERGEDPTFEEYKDNLIAGAIAGSLFEMGIASLTGNLLDKVEPEVEPVTRAPTPEEKALEEIGLSGDSNTFKLKPVDYKFKSMEEMVEKNIQTNHNLMQSGFRPIAWIEDYSPETVEKLKAYVSDPANRIGRDPILEAEYSKRYQESLSKFTPDGIRELGKDPVDFYQPYYDSLTKQMDHISNRLQAAEKAEAARVEKAKTEAPTDEGYERRIKDIQYRNKIADFYDNMGGDINEMRNIQEAIFAQGMDLPPLMKKYLNEVEDAIRMFGGKSHKKLSKKPIDKVSIYEEAYSELTNNYLKGWGFDTKYKSIAEEATEQGARITLGKDLDKLPGELDRELSFTEKLEELREAIEIDPKIEEDLNATRQAHLTRMRDLEKAHKELVDSIRKEKYIDDIVELEEMASLEADPAVKAELKETIEQYHEAMEEAMNPDEFRDVMDSLYSCIRG